MKILFPASADPYCGDAMRLAEDTARTLRAEVRLLYVVDREGIRRAEAGAPPGAIHIARMAEEKIAERQSSEGAGTLEEFGRILKAADVPYTGEVKTGDPREEIAKASAGCDLLVAGISSQFCFAGGDEPGKLVLSLMNDQVIPVLLAASPYRPVKTVVVGCGGGYRAARAVGAMARFGLFRTGCRVILLAVDDSEQGGYERIAEPRRILEDAAYADREERVITGSKAEAFLAFCKEEGADAVVLGGWGKKRWHEFFGLSITGRLLDSKLYHMFLYM